MLAEALALLQETDAIRALRASRWVYPAVNVAHVLGLALLFGAIVPLDLRMLGVARSLDRAALARLLVPVAAAGLALTLASGALLFAVRAGEYAAMPLFWWKMAIVALATVNALAFARRRDGRWAAMAAVVSLAGWTAAIVCGRMLGYVGD